MQQKKRADLDIILDILQMVVEARPKSDFAKSLLHQYVERGSLSKKQLQGLHNKAEQTEGIPAGKLAALEAIILKMPNRFKSELPETKPLYSKDDAAEKMVQDILEKYPQHKRVLFFDSKLKSKETLNPTERSELEKFVKLLLKK